MSRSPELRTLGVWMNGLRVGEWSRLPRGRHLFRYDAAWLASQEARPLSLSLPLAPPDYSYSGEIVEAFFDNLLPDNADIRGRIRRRFSAASLEPFDLLAEIGRDCVGALRLIPEGEEPGDVRRIEARPLDDAAVESILAGITTPLSGGRGEEDAFRISLAGAQEKTALLKRDDSWFEPIGATPTTHILKLPLGKIGPLGLDMSFSPENEWLCSRIAAEFGFKTAPCEVVRFGKTKALAVERFDRRLSGDGTWIVRLPQEDLCQATGTAPAFKYEADGGPGIVRILRLLLGAREPFADRKTFLKAQILFHLLAAPDGHAKNFSLLLERGGRYSLAPLYDIMSAYPVLGHGSNLLAPERLKLAMAVGKNRHYEWRKLLFRHWKETAAACDIGNEILAVMNEVLGNTPQAVSRAGTDLPRDFPDAVAGPIFEGILDTADKLRREIASEDEPK